MASQVLSGSGNATYTNNTGQNVRILINYMASSSSGVINMNWAGASAGSNLIAIGRNLAFFTSIENVPGVDNGAAVANNALGTGRTGPSPQSQGAVPTEIMLAPTQTFSATCGAYNIVVIPEAG